LSILVDKKTKLVVQGITGRDGSFHARQMKAYGTKVVAGVTPGKGGEKVDGIPVFDSVKEAVEKTGANASVIYVPSRFAVDAIYEAADAGVDLIVCISEGIPALDMLKVYNYLKTTKTRLVGPNSPGVISPGLTKVGIMPGHIHKKGDVGVVSRSGTLTYEVVYHLTQNNLGQSTCIGIGGDQIIGTNFIDCLSMFEKDPQTKAVVLIGEIGGTDEEEAAEFIKKKMRKPVVAFVAGMTAPPGKRMEKIAAFGKAGIKVAKTPPEVATLVLEEMSRLKKRKAKAKIRTKVFVSKKAKKVKKKPKKVKPKAKRTISKLSGKKVKKGQKRRKRS